MLGDSPLRITLCQAVDFEHAPAGRCELRATTGSASTLFEDQGFDKICVERGDQRPDVLVAHAQAAPGLGKRAGFGDALQHISLARTNGHRMLDLHPKPCGGVWQGNFDGGFHCEADWLSKRSRYTPWRYTFNTIYLCKDIEFLMSDF